MVGALDCTPARTGGTHRTDRKPPTRSAPGNEPPCIREDPWIPVDQKIISGVPQDGPIPDVNLPITFREWDFRSPRTARERQIATSNEIDRRVVAIFKEWGFAWGGDWSYTDPMHFEMAEVRRPQ